MATLYVTEFTGLGNASSNFGAAFSGAQAPLEPEIASQTVAIGGGPQTSAAFNAATSVVRLHCDAICSVVFSRSSSVVNASTTNRRFAANQTEYFVVPKGDGYVVSVISNS